MKSSNIRPDRRSFIRMSLAFGFAFNQGTVGKVLARSSGSDMKLVILGTQYLVALAKNADVLVCETIHVASVLWRTHFQKTTGTHFYTFATFLTLVKHVRKVHSRHRFFEFGEAS